MRLSPLRWAWLRSTSSSAPCLALLGLSEPLLWLYPALVTGAGLHTPFAIGVIGLTALAAAAPLALEGTLIHPIDPLHPAEALGAALDRAGRRGMNAVRQ